jgi:hypothetical protein
LYADCLYLPTQRLPTPPVLRRVPDYQSVSIFKFLADNHYKIINKPDAQTAQSYDLQYGRPNLSRIKSVRAESAQKQAQEQSDHPGFGAGRLVRGAAGRPPAVWAKGRLLGYFSSAILTKHLGYSLRLFFPAIAGPKGQSFFGYLVRAN